MQGNLAHSMFSRVLFPPATEQEGLTELNLRRSLRYSIPGDLNITEHDLIIFDFETTGLDYDRDRIIEVGAIRVRQGTIIGEFSSLCSTDVIVTEQIEKLTGINKDMLVGQPSFADKLKEFLKFIEGGVLVAHNAEFDLSMLKAACHREGIDFEWPCICTLKLARDLLPDLERKNLDSLAEHYGLSFEARHRSIGDAKVTISVLNHMLENEGSSLKKWRDFQPFKVQ